MTWDVPIPVPSRTFSSSPFAFMSEVTMRRRGASLRLQRRIVAAGELPVSAVAPGLERPEMAFHTSSGLS